jgi:hypothetical protein
MPRMYVLGVPENESLVKVASKDPVITVDKEGPYFRVSSDSDIVIDRRATRCRHAVWYSVVAGIENSVITQHDKDALRVQAR